LFPYDFGFYGHFDPTLTSLCLNRLKRRATRNHKPPSLCCNTDKGLSPLGMVAAGCSWVLPAILPRVLLRLGQPYCSRWGKKRQARHPSLPRVSLACLPADCYLLYAVRVHCCQQEKCCRALNWWGRGPGLFQHPSLL